VYVYLNSLHVSSTHVHRYQENHLYQYDIWYMSLYVGDRLVCIPDGHLHRVTIPHVVLIQLILLIMSTWVLETCREFK